MRMKNPTDVPVTIAELRITIKPGKAHDIPDGYVMPRTAPNGDPMKPIIAMLAPQLEPEDPALVLAYRQNRLTEGLIAEPPPMKSAADLQADGMSPAVAELVASGQAASVPKVGPRAGGTTYEDVAGKVPRK